MVTVCGLLGRGETGPYAGGNAGCPEEAGLKPALTQEGARREMRAEEAGAGETGPRRLRRGRFETGNGMITDTSEKGLERRICTVLTGAPCDVASGEGVGERPASYGVGWIVGIRRITTGGIAWTWCSLRPFLRSTQPKVAEALDLGNDSPTRRQFLARLQGQISKRGTIDVIRGA